MKINEAWRKVGNIKKLGRENGYLLDLTVVKTKSGYMAVGSERTCMGRTCADITKGRAWDIMKEMVEAAVIDAQVRRA